MSDLTSQRADAVAYRERRGEMVTEITRAELGLRVASLAGEVRAVAGPGARVGILREPGIGYAVAFLACLMAGVVAVPVQTRQTRSLAPGDLEEDVVVRDSGAVAVVTDDDLLTLSSAPRSPEPDPEGMGIAFLQYSSGSTDTPKGVCVTHANLAANLAAITSAMAVTAEDRALIWLPPYHDMGLIGGVLTPLWTGIPATLMSPMSFLRDPLSWLRVIGEERATVSGGPNFSYEACVQALRPGSLDALDLSSWSLAFVGSDVVRSATLDRFAGAFSGAGFDPRAFLPCYGLAESTLMVTGVARTELPRRAARGCGGGATELVSAGVVVPGSQMRILDPGGMAERAPGEVGEIVVHGPSVARGYWRRPDLTVETFAPDGSLRTGDLGRLQGDELFVVGRLKDLIILRGRNIHPEDVEAAAGGADERLAGRPVAAFAVDDGDEERLVVVCEVSPDRAAGAEAREAGAQELAARVAAAVTAAVGVTATVELVRRGTLPRTTSGKVRRAASRDGHLAGAWTVLARGGADAGVEVAPETLEQDVVAAATAPAGERAEALSLTIAQWCSIRVGLSVETCRTGSLLEVGVDSLGLARLHAALNEGLGADLTLRDLYAATSLDELASLALSHSAERPPFADVDDAGERPERSRQLDAWINPGQRAMLYLEQLHPGTSMHRLVRDFRVAGSVDVDILRRALAALVERHPVLRTAYRLSDDEFRAEVRRDLAEVLAVAPPGLQAKAAARSWLASRESPIGLAEGRLLDVALASTAKETYLRFSVHHIAVDLSSVAVLWHELDRLIAAELNGVALDLPHASDAAAAWEREQGLAGTEGRRHREWWSTWAREDVAPLVLPLGDPDAGGAVVGPVPHINRHQVELQARELGVTPFAFLLACLHCALASFADDAGSGTPVVGIPTAGRSSSASRAAVGYLTNPIPTRIRVAGETSFAEYARATQVQLAAVLEHQDLPFSEIVRLAGGSTPLGNPLFDVMFVYDEPPAGAPPQIGPLVLGEAGQTVALGPWSLVTEATHAIDLPVELVWEVAWGATGELRAALRHAGRLDKPSATTLHGSFSEVVARATADPSARVADLTVAPYELAQAVTTTSAPDLLNAVHRRVLAAPDAIALRHERTEFSYAGLWQRVAATARLLRKRRLPGESLVLLALPRTPDLVIYMLAVLLADLAYSPLEPTTPAGRRASLVEEVRPALVITSPEEVDEWHGLGVEVSTPFAATAGPSLNPESSVGPASPHQLAYVLFTSGSTGRPKAVGVTRGGLASFARSAGAMYSDLELANALASTPVTFDLSVLELLVPLTRGGTIVLQTDLFELEGSPRRDVVTMVSAVTGLARQLAADGVPRAVRTLNTGGETVPLELVRALHRSGVTRVRNLYGPSEDTTFSTVVDLAADEPVTVGTALPESCGRVVGTDLRPVTTGAQGQLVLGGAKLARGYVGRPALTAERFVPDAYGSPGARIYLTGDTVTRRPGGELAFVGRQDRQVKVGGVRVELDEVEAILQSHPDIAAAAVVVQLMRGGRVLVAHVASELDPGKVTSHAAMHLTSAAVPRHVRVVPALPLTSSGKIDRRSLPMVTLPGDPPGSEPILVDDLSPSERTVAETWAKAFAAPAPDRHTDFFEQGGHSLLALRLLAMLERRCGVRVPLQAFFEDPTIAALAARVVEGVTAPAGAVREMLPEVVRCAPLIASQRPFWHAYSVDPASTAYVLVADMEVTGPLDVPRLERALRSVIGRHDALRTVFADSGTGVEQRLIDVDPALPVEEVDADQICDVVADEAARPFALEERPAWRCRLLRVSASEHHLVFAAHHIICDRWSADMFARDLGECYSTDTGGTSVPAASFLARSASSLAQSDPASVAWWRDRIEDTPLLGLGLVPEDGSGLPRGTADVVETAISASEWDRVRQLARVAGATEFMVLAGIAWIALGTQAARPRFAVGVPTAGRNLVSDAELFGCLVNTVVLRADLDGCETFRSLIARVKDEISTALSGDEVPVSEVAAALVHHGRHTSRPLFDVLLSVQESAPTVTMDGLRVTVVPTEPVQAKFDLTVRMVPAADGGVRVLFERDPSRIGPDVIQALAARVDLLVERLRVDGLDAPVHSLLTADEGRTLTTYRSGGPAPGAAASTIPAILAKAALTVPDRAAVVSRAGTTTYAALWDRASRVAAGLSARGVARGEVVSILHARTPDMVAAALGVLIAGAAYLPLRADDPASRQDGMLADAGAVLVLCDDETAAWCDADVPVMTVDEVVEDTLAPLPPVDVLDDDLAYIMFTSGSTGRPKGVAVTHRGVAARVGWIVDNFGADELAAVLGGTSLGFDISIFELFGTLAGRGTVVLAEDALDLMDHPDRDRVSLVIAVPSALAVLAEYPDLPSALRTVCSGGETLTPNLADRLRRGSVRRVVNTYGPTEDTFCTTHVDLTSGQSPVPIGSSLPGSTLDLVDDAQRLVPPGAVGEVRLGGVGVARGYIGSPSLTAERFLPDPGGEPGSRCYLTGDLGRWLDTGVEFLGRADGQVKVRGHRVELGEIENLLLDRREIAEAAVLIVGGSPTDARLVACIRPAGGAELDFELVTASLRRILPAYMIPEEVVELAEFPRTSTGKLDRDRMVREYAAGRGRRPDTSGAVEPKGEVEQAVARIWEEVLSLHRVGRFDQFFTLGGDSLTAGRMVARVRKRYDVHIPLRDLFDDDRLVEFARHVSEAIDQRG